MPRTKAFNEEEVLQKAVALFWKQGYAATSMQDLVDHLGINRASLYATYGGKQQLFQRALERYQADNSKVVQDFLASQPDVKKGFQQLFKRAIEAALHDPDRKGCFVVNTTTEMIPGHPEMRTCVQGNQRDFETGFYDYLKQGEAAGQFSPGKDLHALATLLFTLYNGLQVLGKVNPDPVKLSKTVDAALSLLD